MSDLRHGTSASRTAEALPRRHFHAVPADELRVLAILRESDRPRSWSSIAEQLGREPTIEVVRGVRDACRALEQAELVLETGRKSCLFVAVRSLDPVEPDDWWRRIVVPDHVRRRVAERLAWEGTGREIAVEVRLDLICGRVSDTRPNWTRGPRQRSNAADAASYAWDDAGTRCWVLARDGRRIAVMTLLTSNEEHSERGHERRLRAGMRRR